MITHRFVALLVATLLIVLLVPACRQYPAPSTIQAEQDLKGCRMVEHLMGKTCVPLYPRRILTIPSYSFANSLALGIKPVATAYDVTEPFPIYLRDKVAGVELIGGFTQTNLEKVLRLKPDLIVSDPWSPNVYKQLSRIAPTVILANDLSWKQELVELAKVLDREQQCKQLMENYWQRIDKLKQNLQERRPIQVSAAGLFPGFAYAYGEKSPAGTVLNDIGLQRPPLQRGNFYYVLEYLSEELLSALDGDILFYLTRGGDQGAKKVLEEVTQRPLWQQLSAVQRNQAHLIGSHWHTGDFFAINAILDDLEKYLIKVTS